MRLACQATGPDRYVRPPAQHVVIARCGTPALLETAKVGIYALSRMMSRQARPVVREAVWIAKRDSLNLLIVKLKTEVRGEVACCI